MRAWLVMQHSFRDHIRVRPGPSHLLQNTSHRDYPDLHPRTQLLLAL
jgi:hypothetical protein